MGIAPFACPVVHPQVLRLLGAPQNYAKATGKESPPQGAPPEDWFLIGI